MKERILLSWSGGKDSTMTLYDIHKVQQYDIAALLTTVTEGYERISIHGVRRVLLEQQAASLRIPLQKVYIPKEASNEVYESRMLKVLLDYEEQGITSVAFGDLFLEDIKKYREAQLARLGMRGLFPIWQRNTTEVIQSFIELGFKALIVCVDLRVLSGSFVGRMIDETFLRDLPAHVDPCGENGEFHTFVFDGPIFGEEIEFTSGEIVVRGDFCFCDLLPCDYHEGK